MKRLKTTVIFLAALMCSLLISFPAAAETNFFKSYPKRLATPKTSNPRILLIGNSLTYYNYGSHGIQYVLSGLCKKNGINATILDITKGGHLLYKCSAEDDVLHDKIEAAFQQKWDYVVLQGASYETLKYPTEMLNTIENYFKPKIKASGAQMVLYMTWAPDSAIVNYGDDPTTYNRDARQEIITNVYYKLGEHFGCAVAPSGLAVARYKKLYPATDLHYSKSDRLHPNCQGTYLSACTIWATLFNKNPYGTAFYPDGTTSEKCGYAQSVAADVTTRMGTSSQAKLTFSSKGYVLNKGKSKTLHPTTSSGTRVIRWTSSDPKVASVSANGFTSVTVKARSNGRTTITALLNNNTTASCDVIVTPTSFKLGAKEKYTLDLSGKFTWSSSRPSVAKVSGGKIVAGKKGTATLTGKDSTGVTVKLTVTVKAAPVSVKVKKVPYVRIGRTAKLGAYISSGCSYTGLKYKSSNPNIISIDQNGLMTGKRTGKVTITATAYNGKKLKCTVRCIIPVQKIYFKNAKSTLTLKKGKTLTLKTGFAPTNASIKTLKWKSSNKKVVSVSSKGKLKALKKGTATITATATDGTGIKVKLKVKVKK